MDKNNSHSEMFTIPFPFSLIPFLFNFSSLLFIYLFSPHLLILSFSPLSFFFPFHFFLIHSFTTGPPPTSNAGSPRLPMRRELPSVSGLQLSATSRSNSFRPPPTALHRRGPATHLHSARRPPGTPPSVHCLQLHAAM
jgi:hypothetical protein